MKCLSNLSKCNMISVLLKNMDMHRNKLTSSNVFGIWKERIFSFFNLYHCIILKYSTKNSSIFLFKNVLKSFVFSKSLSFLKKKTFSPSQMYVLRNFKEIIIIHYKNTYYI